MTFRRACRRVLLKEPRVTPAFIMRNLAFSSIVNVVQLIFGPNTSINNVSSCILVKLLFFANILIIGSFRDWLIHFWTVSLTFNSFTKLYLFRIQNSIQRQQLSYKSLHPNSIHFSAKWMVMWATKRCPHVWNRRRTDVSRYTPIQVWWIGVFFLWRMMDGSWRTDVIKYELTRCANDEILCDMWHHMSICNITVTSYGGSKKSNNSMVADKVNSRKSDSAVMFNRITQDHA